MAEAFQLTAQAHPDRIALRTKDDELTITWRECADRVRAMAAGLAGLGARARRHGRADAHQPARVPLVDCGGHAPRRDAVLDLQHLHARADPVPGERTPRRASWSPRRRSRTRVRALDGVEHVVVVDGEDDVVRVEHAAESFDFEAAWRSGRARRPAHADLHLGHDRDRRRACSSRTQPHGADRRLRQMIQFPDEGRVISWLPMAHIAERASHHYLPMFARLHHHLLPGPAPGRRLPAGGPARPGSSPCRASGRS